MGDMDEDVAAIANIDVVPRILDVVCRTTGMGFSAVARVTDTRWVACAVRDEIAFGLQPGGELQLETTLCDEIRQSGRLVVIDDVATDTVYCHHHTPRQYGFRSYISVPIVLGNGSFFGTLCAIDPRPVRLNTPETVEMFKLFAELIASHLDARDRLADLEQRVEQRTAALQALTGQLQRVREDERTGLARELHDEVGQALTALKIYVDSTAKALDDLPELQATRPLVLVARMEGVIESILDGIKRIVTELRPAVLDALGCAAAAEWLASEFGKRMEVTTRFESDPDIVLSADASTAVFRILQEALTNIARHAQASLVEITLRAGDGMVTLRVADNGRGVSETDVRKPTSFGLRGMAERVRALGGAMTIKPRPTGGTELIARVPAAAAEHEIDLAAHNP